MLRPIYQPLNDAVVAIAARLFPNGFDVAQDALDENLVPINLAQLNLAMADGRLMVSGEYSEDTIFGDPAVNHAFRAWHDWTHWAHQTAFDLLGEIETCNAQIRDLGGYRLWPDAASYNLAVELLRAEVIGQAEHHAKHGRFPERQREFALAYMVRMVGTGAW